jgi:hypothetical protein
MVDPAFGRLYHVEENSVVEVLEECTTTNISPNDKGVCCSETSATQPNSPWLEHPKAESTLTVNRR